MNGKHKNLYQARKGAALVLAMIFLAMFGALAVALSSMSGTNVEASANLKKASRALTNAQSGMEIMRHILETSDITIACKLNDPQLMSKLRTALAQYNPVSAVSINMDGPAVVIPAVTLNADPQQSFTSRITRIGSSLYVDVTGYAEGITRTVRTKYSFRETGNPNFDYGVATKGPLKMHGNVTVEGLVAVDSDVYIDSWDTQLALEILGAKSYIQGSVKIANPNATWTIPNGSVGGTIQKGVPRVAFPAPDPEYFFNKYFNIFSPFYLNGPTYNVGSTIPSTVTNAVIGPGRNPAFNGGTINGILYIKAPNKATFKNVTITGLIVCEGDIADNSGTNSLTFSANMISKSVDQLPHEARYLEVRKETGTFIMAPGFKVSMGANCESINGAMVGNGFDFSGCALSKNGAIYGSVINYSDKEMTLGGTSDLYFNRSGRGAIPAGFAPVLELVFDAGSYEEPEPGN